MTVDQRFAIAITGLSLVFLVLSAMLGLLVNVIRKWTQTEDKLSAVIEDVKEDRLAVDKRLRWLEEYLWRKR